MVRVIDRHNHVVAPEVVAFLEREGARYHTRIIEEDGRRFAALELEHAAQSGLRGVEIPCDVIRLRHPGRTASLV